MICFCSHHPFCGFFLSLFVFYLFCPNIFSIPISPCFSFALSTYDWGHGGFNYLVFCFLLFAFCFFFFFFFLPSYLSVVLSYVRTSYFTYSAYQIQIGTFLCLRYTRCDRNLFINDINFSIEAGLFVSGHWQVIDKDNCTVLAEYKRCLRTHNVRSMDIQIIIIYTYHCHAGLVWLCWAASAGLLNIHKSRKKKTHIYTSRVLYTYARGSCICALTLIRTPESWNTRNMGKPSLVRANLINARPAVDRYCISILPLTNDRAEMSMLQAG